MKAAKPKPPVDPPIEGQILVQFVDPQIDESEFASVGNPEQVRFLACFVNGGYTVYHAAAMAKVKYSRARQWDDQPFMSAFLLAKEIVKDKLERELIRRAMEGYDPKGVKYDSDLLKLYLRKLDPDYREKGSMDVSVTVDVTDRLRLGRERARKAFLMKEKPAIETTAVAITEG